MLLTHKHADWYYFVQLVNETLNTNISLKSNFDIDIANEHLIGTIHNAASNSIPQGTNKVKTHLHCQRRLRKIWQNNRHLAEKNQS